MSKLKKYRILNLEDKQAIITALHENTSTEQFQSLSEKYSTSIKNLRRWFNAGIERKKGCGRKKLNPNAEELLRLWVLEESVTQGKRIRRAQLKEKAIQLFNDNTFKASKAWQDEFIRKFDIKFMVNEQLHQMRLLNPMQESKFMEMKIKRNGSNVDSQAQSLPVSKIEQDKLNNNNNTNDDDNESMKSTSLPHIKKEESNQIVNVHDFHYQEDPLSNWINYQGEIKYEDSMMHYQGGLFLDDSCNPKFEDEPYL